MVYELYLKKIAQGLVGGNDRAMFWLVCLMQSRAFR